ncbi:lactonase family protein [Flavobacterium eburneipallidum]|uniref:lactonase family protein n=1 Tax=Flavobacterium eburneipallidum TaxID=3003263 RepID=UPI00248304CF|nr:lactonase family protein [Flavobacterium eburneipallidum]
MKQIYFYLLFLFATVGLQAQENKFNLIVGTYNRTCESKGMYVYEFNSNTGDLTLKNNTENVLNPSYLSVSSDTKFVYSVNQNKNGGNENGVSAFKYDSKTGKLDFINKKIANADGPCYIIDDDKNIITANYSSGSISVFGKNNDGSVSEVKQIVQHFGKGIDRRQEMAHAHMTGFSPDKKYVLVSDLGTDKIYSYQYNPNAEKEVLVFKDTVNAKKSSGPRHFTFSKDGKYVYLLQEIDGSLTTFSYADGILKKVDETSIVAPDFKGETSSADIHISPDGKFLYASNRGTANDISAFKILKKGKLEFVSRTSTLGKTPRNFTIDPTGNFLLVGNQNSNDIVIFKRDKKTGSLTATGKKVELCSPVCFVFTKI